MVSVVSQFLAFVIGIVVGGGLIFAEFFAEAIGKVFTGIENVAGKLAVDIEFVQEFADMGFEFFGTKAKLHAELLFPDFGMGKLVQGLLEGVF